MEQDSWAIKGQADFDVMYLFQVQQAKRIITQGIDAEGNHWHLLSH
jgi:hypothetical protein